MKPLAKEYYEANRVSMAKLSENSTDLFGDHISIDQLKKWSQEDGGWKKPEIDDIERTKKLSDMIYERIEENPNMSDKDFSTLINTWVNLQKNIKVDPIQSSKPTREEIMDIVNAQSN